MLCCFPLVSHFNQFIQAADFYSVQAKEPFLPQANLEQLVFEEKNKAQRLQTELDVSEQVQRDFVKLSQTLQVRESKVRATLISLFLQS